MAKVIRQREDVLFPWTDNLRPEAKDVCQPAHYRSRREQIHCPLAKLICQKEHDLGSQAYDVVHEAAIVDQETEVRGLRNNAVDQETQVGCREVKVACREDDILCPLAAIVDHENENISRRGKVVCQGKTIIYRIAALLPRYGVSHFRKAYVEVHERNDERQRTPRLRV